MLDSSHVTVNNSERDLEAYMCKIRWAFLSYFSVTSQLLLTYFPVISRIFPISQLFLNQVYVNGFAKRGLLHTSNLHSISLE